MGIASRTKWERRVAEVKRVKSSRSWWLVDKVWARVKRFVGRKEYDAGIKVRSMDAHRKANGK